MARPLRIQFEGALYHIISRGNERMMIFLEEADRINYLNMNPNYLCNILKKLET